jgi:hypothetical protein
MAHYYRARLPRLPWKHVGDLQHLVGRGYVGQTSSCDSALQDGLEGKVEDLVYHDPRVSGLAVTHWYIKHSRSTLQYSTSVH